MAYLLDSNVFLRLVPKNDPERHGILDAFQRLRANQQQLCYTTQILAEFWTVCTRPAAARGGYGLTPEETDRKVRVAGDEPEQAQRRETTGLLDSGLLGVMLCVGQFNLNFGSVVSFVDHFGLRTFGHRILLVKSPPQRLGSGR